MKIAVHLSIGFPGANVDDELDLPDDYTEEDIEAEVREWALERAEWSWRPA